MRAKTPATPSQGFFRKIIFSKKVSCGMPPPGPPHRPPIFLNFFQFWTTGAPFYIFFFYYITVFLFIFSLFLLTFFSIIERRAVVIQPPQFNVGVLAASLKSGGCWKTGYANCFPLTTTRMAQARSHGPSPYPPFCFANCFPLTASRMAENINAGSRTCDHQIMNGRSYPLDHLGSSPATCVFKHRDLCPNRG